MKNNVLNLKDATVSVGHKLLYDMLLHLFIKRLIYGLNEILDVTISIHIKKCLKSFLSYVIISIKNNMILEA